MVVIVVVDKLSSGGSQTSAVCKVDNILTSGVGDKGKTRVTGVKLTTNNEVVCTSVEGRRTSVRYQQHRLTQQQNEYRHR